MAPVNRKCMNRNDPKGGVTMNQEDLKLLLDWFEQNKDHKLNFIEKEGIKLAVRKANTVGDLLQTALDMLRK